MNLLPSWAVNNWDVFFKVWKRKMFWLLLPKFNFVFIWSSMHSEVQKRRKIHWLTFKPKSGIQFFPPGFTEVRVKFTQHFSILKWACLHSHAVWPPFYLALKHLVIHSKLRFRFPLPANDYSFLLCFWSIFSHAGGMHGNVGLSISQLVHFVPDWNFSTTIKWIDMTFAADINVPLRRTL